MPRAMWSGSISFGLVSIPIKLFSAVSRKDVRFNQIDSTNGARIKQKRTNAETGEVVEYENIVKGYELGDGRYVTISPDELDGLDPKAGRTIDLMEFVELSQIDPVFYGSPYYLAPDPVAAKAYALLVESMERSNRVGIARFVMRTKEYLAALRAVDGKLMLSTMVYHDEVNSIDELEGLEVLDDINVSDAEVKMAEQLIESLSADFEPEKYSDLYREKVLELIERKAAGETDVVIAAEAPEAEKVVDLMAALEASVAAAKESRKGHPTAKASAKKKAAPKKKKAAPKKKSA